MQVATSRPVGFLMLLAIAAALSIACNRSERCSRGDMTEFMSPAMREMFAGEQYEWMRDAKVCAIGEYRVIGPAKGDDPAILIVKGRDAVFAREKGSSMLFRNGLPFATLTEGNTPEMPSSLNYDVSDASGNLVSVLDRDLDGQADLRIRHVTGQEPSIELWRSDRWRTLVRKGDQPGFMQDGQFVPLTPAEARPDALTE